MTDPSSLDPDIARYYSEEWNENDRSRSGLGELELIRTRGIVERYLGADPLRVLDVGGATGVHAEWLLESGHSVDLVDPVARHVEDARTALGDDPGFRAHLGDARDLPFGPDTFDVVLLVGPLYHLQLREDRMTTWREARRVCKPGGITMGSVISRYASLFSGLSEDLIFDPVFRRVVEADLKTGHHRNPDGREFFTTAYFHSPGEATEEAEEAGFEVVDVLGIEGIAPWIPRLERSWADPERRDVIVETAKLIESEPSLLGLSPHIMVVCRDI